MVTAEESNADMYSSGVIYFETVLIMLIIIYDDVFSNQHREVIHDQTCKDLLYHTVLFLRMKSNKTNMVLQFPERSFNAPAQLVDMFDILSREFIVPEISNDCFVLTFCDLYSYDPEFKRIGIF